MTRPDGIELCHGRAPWMAVAHALVSLLAAGSILNTTTHLWWIVVLLAALISLHVATARQMRRAAEAVPRFRLFDNGTAALLTRAGAVPAMLGAGAWVSRWFSVVTLQPLDGRRRLFCIVCRSTNAVDDYRRMLVLLRLRQAQDAAMRWHWS